MSTHIYKSENEVVKIIEDFHRSQPKGFYTFGVHTLNYINNLSGLWHTKGLELDVAYVSTTGRVVDDKIVYSDCSGFFFTDPFEFTRVKMINVEISFIEEFHSPISPEPLPRRWTLYPKIYPDKIKWRFDPPVPDGIYK
jgi:hypothetical protein